MRQQHEEITKLRHDIVSHFEALKGLTNEQQTAAYLDALIGQNNKVRDIVLHRQ